MNVLINCTAYKEVFGAKDILARSEIDLKDVKDACGIGMDNIEKKLKEINDFVPGFSSFSLNPAEQVIFLASNKHQIVICQIGIFLFNFPFHLIPISFDS